MKRPILVNADKLNYVHASRIMKTKISTLAVVVAVAAMLVATSAVAAAEDAFAGKKRHRGDNNAQTAAANNDCPARVFSLLIGIQQQASANCLNDINMIQDSDGAAIASTPSNAAQIKY